MRHVLLLAALSALAVPATAQPSEIPNASFDVWTALDPQGWLVTNNEEMTVRTVDPVGNAKSGPFAAQMTVIPVPGFPTIAISPGMETCPGNTCRDENGNTIEEAVFPVSGRHPAFCGYYKSSLLNGDKILLGPSLIVNEMPIGILDQGTGDGFITQNASDWTLFIKPFTYVSGATPALGNVAMSIVSGAFPGAGQPSIGSSATIDDLFYCALDGTPVDGGGGTNASGEALLIIDDVNAPFFADQNVEGLLTSLDFEVIIISDEAVTSADANDKAIILISSSVDPTVLTVDFSTTATPLIVWDADLYDDLKLATASGTTAPVTVLSIANDAHPIAEGFAVGDTTVYAEALPMTFGSPGSGAVAIGTSGGQSTLFAYDDGAAMTSGTAPARRVAFFASSTGTGSATGAGMALLENAIIWAADLDFTVAAEPLGGQALNTPRLHVNHPNPFSSATSLEYELATASTVSLAVYDARGRRVAVLVDDEQAPGIHRVEWAPKGLAPGMYLGVLRADSYVITRRMHLTR